MGHLGSLGEAGVKGAFYEALELGDGWAQSGVGIVIPSDSKIENHRWMGQVPQLRESQGSTIVAAMRARGLQVTNKDFKAAIKLYRDDIRRDKTGQVLGKPAEFGERVGDHWNKIAAAELEANPTGWDGVALFSAAHVDGKAGTQTNLLTSTEVSALNVTTAAAPTKAECISIMIGLASQFYTLKDDQGEPTNGRARVFGLLCPSNLFAAFSEAASSALNAAGGTNAMRGQRFMFEPEIEPRLTSTTVVYPYIKDARSKGLILQSEVEPEIEFDYKDWVEGRYVSIHAFASRVVAPGDWRKIGKATLS